MGIYMWDCLRAFRLGMWVESKIPVKKGGRRMFLSCLTVGATKRRVLIFYPML